MALLEFHCKACKKKFEQITSDGDPDRGKCPKCQGKDTERLISKFAIGGLGDLRESTVHGCHAGCHHIGPGEVASSTDSGSVSGASDTAPSEAHSHSHSHEE